MSELSNPSVPPPWPDYVPKLFTATDLATLPTEVPSGPVRYELHHGRLITMPPPGDIHCALELNVACELKVQGDKKGLGLARSGEVAIILRRNPDHVFAADAVFISNERLPIRRSPEGYLETIPDLVLEVRSKNETLTSLQRKAEEYLQAGVRVVWVLDPIHRNLVEYRRDVAPRTYHEDETFTVEDVIPGFAMQVSAALKFE
jgi:Uma2 family endonuclease